MIEKYTSDDYFERLSSLVLEFTQKYRNLFVNEIMKNDQYLKEPQRFFYVIIHKTTCSLEASNLFIRNFDSRRDYHIPLFIILRTILSDILTAEHVNYFSTEKKNCKELIEEVYFDHIDNVIKTCNKSFRHIYQWNENQTAEYISKIKVNSRFYDSNGNPTRNSRPKSLSNLIVEIFSSVENKKSLVHHRRAYELYTIFSKIEHLGEFSFNLLHRGYDEKEQKKLLLDLHDSLTFIIGALVNYKDMWIEIQYNNVEFVGLCEKIEALHPSKINII